MCVNGTSRLGEVLAVILCFVDSDFKLQQHLVRMMFPMKSLTGEETARELINVLTSQPQNKGSVEKRADGQEYGIVQQDQVAE